MLVWKPCSITSSAPVGKYRFNKRHFKYYLKKPRIYIENIRARNLMRGIDTYHFWHQYSQFLETFRSNIGQVLQQLLCHTVHRVLCGRTVDYKCSRTPRPLYHTALGVSTQCCVVERAVWGTFVERACGRAILLVERACGVL